MNSAAATAEDRFSLKKGYLFAAGWTALSTLGGTIFALFDQNWRSVSIGALTCVTTLDKRLAAGLGEKA